MDNDRTEARRAAYEETPPHRIDRTPGDYAIPRSPFMSPEAIADAMSKYTDETWRPVGGHVGGFGEKVSLINQHNDKVIHIWRDASGGWHPEKKVGQNWLPDLTLLDALIEASKPKRACEIHASATMDQSSYCTTCAIDAAIMARWEINIGMRCEMCGKRNEYCTC